MKKWTIVAVILMCCLVYAIVKLSMSEDQNVNDTTEEKQSTKQINAGNTDKATPAEETQSAKQINADDTDKATPEEGSGSAAPPVQVEDVNKPEEGSGSAVSPAQVEAVTKVFNEFRNAIMSEDYEQAWKLTSESLKSEGTFEKFKKDMAEEGVARMASATIHPESAINIEGRVGLLVTTPKDKLYLFFIQEDGQWKLDGGKPAENVDTSKE